MNDLEEEAVEFRRSFDLATAGRFRRIAGIGPAYEALQDNGEFIRVRIVDTEEEFDYRKDDAELDPPA